MPPACSSSARSATWNDSSRSMSRCVRPGRRTFQRRRCQVIVCLCVTNHTRHAFREPLPAFLFLHELLPAFRGQGIEACVAVLLRLAPIGANPALLFHAVKRGV